MKCILQNYIILQNVKASGCCWSQGKLWIHIYIYVQGHPRMILFLKVHSRYFLGLDGEKKNTAVFVKATARTPNCERFNYFKHGSLCYYRQYCLQIIRYIAMIMEFVFTVSKFTDLWRFLQIQAVSSRCYCSSELFVHEV